MSPLQTIKSYILWTHPRGGFHYDVMVTAILAFIFLTPRSVFKDSPNYRPPHPNETIVKPDGSGGFIYEVSSAAVSANGAQTDAALKNALRPVAGDVTITRYVELRNNSGKVSGYRIWAHR
ncbi:MAG: hypothetical protein JOZ10_18385 [Acidobacteria bacterium]|nr:hypothetical protein [Acidobacteriota bacterium]MBV9146592.1 hypothetical protein [Acidobacteriota bacterium]